MNPFRTPGTIDTSYEKEVQVEVPIEAPIEAPKISFDFYQSNVFTVCDFSKNDYFKFENTQELFEKIEKLYGKISFVYLEDTLRNDYDIVFKMLDESKIILRKYPYNSLILHKQ